MSDSEDNLICAGGGEIDAGEFSLVITSDTLEPAEITGLLGIQPTDSHRRGDLNQAGKPFPFGRWRLATPRIDFRAGQSNGRWIVGIANKPGWGSVGYILDTGRVPRRK